MIHTQDGHFKSEYTIEEIEHSLQREVSLLTPAEREALELLLADMEDEGPLYDSFSTIDWARQPVDMEQFVMDPYYLGETCESIYPCLLRDLIELFDGDYDESVSTGAIGVGKTFFASIGMCRIIYEISCMKNPYKTFGLSPDSGIAMVGLSVNEYLAQKVVFENIATKIKASPYFQQHFAFRATKKELRFPGKFLVAARSSSDTSALGLNLIGGLMDEGNFMKVTKTKKVGGGRNIDNYDQAQNLYQVIKRRIKSRFEHQGKLPGKLFLVSSKNTRNDFTERRIQVAAQDTSIFVRDYSSWGVRPESYQASKVFHVLVGNELIHSQILAEEEVESFQAKAEELDGLLIIEVPEEFRTDFESDLEGSIRDLGGVATIAVNPFIQRRDKVLAARVDHWKHPFSTEVHDPGYPGQFMWDHMASQVEERTREGVTELNWRPKLNSTALRHVHIDPSLTGDRTGLAMVHIGGWKNVIRRAQDGTKFVEHAPIFVVDLSLAITPPVGGEIILGDIRHLVYELSQHGYSIQGITLDSWNSADSIQQFRAQGYTAGVLSVDASPEPYDTLKTAFYEDRVKMYDYPILIKELEELQEDRSGRTRKIDHPPKGSKDVADAVAGAVHSLHQHVLAHPIPMMPGVETQADPWLPSDTPKAPEEIQPIEDTMLPAFLGGDFETPSY